MVTLRPVLAFDRVLDVSAGVAVKVHTYYSSAISKTGVNPTPCHSWIMQPRNLQCGSRCGFSAFLVSHLPELAKEAFPNPCGIGSLAPAL